MDNDLPRWLYWCIAVFFITVGLVIVPAELGSGLYTFCRKGGDKCGEVFEVDAWFVLAAIIHAALFLVPGLALLRHLLKTRHR